MRTHTHVILYALTSHRSGRAERRLYIKVSQVTATTSSPEHTYSEEVLLTSISEVVTIVTMLFVD